MSEPLCDFPSAGRSFLFDSCIKAVFFSDTLMNTVPLDLSQLRSEQKHTFPLRVKCPGDT